MVRGNLSNSGGLSAEAIAKSLGGASRSAGGWVCRCPSHDDKHASLSITEKDGKTLWFCHAGCSQDTVRQALVSRGLIPDKPEPGYRPKQQPPPPATGRTLTAHDGGKATPPPAGGPGRIVATYDYVDLTGQLLFQVCRFEPKTFRQRRPKGNGWEWGLGRTQPIPYRLPELADAATVFVPEGEKDVERLRALGFTATCNPMGAGKWRTEYGEYLTGKHVVVLPDNDDTGRKHAEDVALSCAQGGARSIRVVALPRLPEKGDVSDWLDAGGTAEELRALVRATPLWQNSMPQGDVAWRTKLLQGEHGPLGNEANAEIALSLAPELAGCLRHDAFRSVTECREVPWDQRPEWRPWTDEDTTNLTIWLQQHDIDIRPNRVDPVVTVVAKRTELHAVRDYLNGLTWDGEERIDDWLLMYLGCTYTEDNPAQYRYLRAIGRRFLIAAVARVMRPGCKVDNILVLEGPQGIGKSTALRILFGDPFFTDEIAEIGSKDAAQDLLGKWGVELSELSAVTKGDLLRVKAFASRSVDHYRPSYARRSQDFPRQCVFAGTTNQSQYLADETGNRRYWPARCTRVDKAALLRDRDQLWAEALHAFKEGDQWWLKKEEDEYATVQQEERTDVDPWHGTIERYVEEAFHEHITVEQLLQALSLPLERADQKVKNRLGRIMRTLGWEYKKPRVGPSKRPKWCYVRLVKG